MDRDDATKQSIIEQVPSTLKRIEEMRQLIESLHEPWRPINDTVVSVNACIKRAVDKVFPGDEPPWIKFSLSDEPLEIKTTPEMLTEAFKVLAKNAKEAMQDLDDANKSLYIESRLKGNLIEVVVQDSGMGISPENLGKVFEMRFTTKTSGLGFGLFWARDYIRGLGGSISVSSAEMRGTIFTVILPVLSQLPDSQAKE
jgi:signal transduction histidine kinase